MNNRWKWIALGQIVATVFLIAGFGITREMNDNPFISGRGLYFSDTIHDGLTGNLPGTTVSTIGLRTLSIDVSIGGTSSVVIQASRDDCANFSTLNTFTESTWVPYRDIWADCVRVTSTWTAGTQTVTIRGGN